jgi:PAS domain S-box-containing protein
MQDPAGHAKRGEHTLAQFKRNFRFATFAVGAIALAFVVLGSLQIRRASWMQRGRAIARLGRDAQRVTAEGQSALRRFLITRDPDDRAVFDRDAHTAAIRLDSLVALTTDNASQQARAQRFREAVRLWTKDGSSAALDSTTTADAAETIESALFQHASNAGDAFLAPDEKLYNERVARERRALEIAALLVGVSLVTLWIGLVIMRRRMTVQVDIAASHAEDAERRNDALGAQGVILTEQNEELRQQTRELQRQASDLEEQARMLAEQEAELEARVDDLRVSDDRFRAVVNSMTDIVFTLDLDQRITQLYGSGVQREQVDPARLLGRGPEDVFGPERSRIHREANDAALLGETVTYDWSVGADDRTLNFTSTVAPLRDANENVIGVIGIARDMTTHHKQEQTLSTTIEKYRHAQKLEAVGLLAGGVAHDFNNLLTVVIAYASMLLSEHGPGDPDRESIEEIKHAAEHGANLTRQLLAFSRQQVLRSELLDLSEIVARTKTMLGRTIDSSIGIRVRLANDPVPVIADSGQLEQIIMNLTVNARDAMPTGGTLTISTSNVFLTENAAAARDDMTPGWYAVLAVEDTGIGMSEETQSRIFEPFFTTKPVGKGTGLGLATVHGIVQQSGGQLNVTSAPGKGTCIEIFLPRARVEGAAEPRATGEFRSADFTTVSPPDLTLPDVVVESATILLVDDDDTIRTAVSRLLGRSGYTVIPASSAVDALRMLEQESRHVDLVLSDMVMPGMSGAELAYEVRVRFPHAAVVLMSGYTKDRVLDDEVLGAETLFLEKPFSMEQLGATVAKALTAGRLRSATMPAEELESARDGRRVLDTIVNGIDAIVWEANAGTGKYHYVSRRAESLLGYPLARWRTKGFFESILHDDDRAGVMARRESAAQTGKSFNDEYRLRAQSGAIVWVRDVVQAGKNVDGSMTQLRGVLIDITERKRVERELIDAKETAERANRSKSQFLSLISHELRTPLTAVIGFSSVLQKNRQNRLSATDLQFVDRISANGTMLLNLVNDLLELTDMETELEPKPMVPVDLAALVEAVTVTFAQRAQAAELALTWSIEAGTPHACSHPVLLRTVLTKVIDNAIKFTPSGSVAIHAAPGDPRGNTVRLEVADTGVGIAPDMLERIFAPFEQGEDFPVRQRGGTGLGLHLAQRHCELIGARLSVASTVGQGTKITIVMPSVAALD